MKASLSNKLLLLGLLIGAAAGCENPATDGEPRKEPGLYIVAGAGVADSVDVRPAQALVVELIGDDGRPRAGVPVRFESTTAASGGNAAPTVRVSEVNYDAFRQQLADTTDKAGRAYARVQLGTRAGPGAVMVTVPTLGLQVTADYTIQAGSATRVITAPQDTMMYVGGSFSVRATVEDRYGNPRTDAASLRVASGPATLTGATVTGTAFGGAVVVARIGGAEDTTHLSIMPQGTIAAYTAMAHTGHELAIYTFNLDGSNLRKLVSTVVGNGYWGDMPSTWSADGTRLYFHDSNLNHTTQLYVYDFTTSSRRRLIEPAGQLPNESWPRRSFDGQWVYFTGGSYGEPTIHRVRADGTGRTQVGTGRDPSLSPDGTRMAYITGTSLVISTLATGHTITVPGVAATPRWSPLGDEIAYLSMADSYSFVGELRAVRRDGTGVRAVDASGTTYRAHFDYSPDGKYVIASTRVGVPTVINVATGAAVPVKLPQLDHGLVAASWKP